MFKKLFIISLLALPCRAQTDSADDFFHRGAQFYVFGEKQKAQSEVTSGLEKYPRDAMLSSLAELLKKEEEQKEQNKDQQNQQNQQNDQKKDDQKKDDQQQNQSQ